MAWISGCIGLLFVTPKTETPVFNADAVTTVRGLAGMWRALGSVVSAVSATREAPSSLNPGVTLSRLAVRGTGALSQARSRPREHLLQLGGTTGPSVAATLLSSALAGCDVQAEILWAGVKTRERSIFRF